MVHGALRLFAATKLSSHLAHIPHVRGFGIGRWHRRRRRCRQPLAAQSFAWHQFRRPLAAHWRTSGSGSTSGWQSRDETLAASKYVAQLNVSEVYDHIGVYITKYDLVLEELEDSTSPTAPASRGTPAFRVTFGHVADQRRRSSVCIVGPQTFGSPLHQFRATCQRLAPVVRGTTSSVYLVGGRNVHRHLAANRCGT